MPFPLPTETIEAFRRDGAVPLYGLFADWVEPLRRGIDANIAAPSAIARIYDDAQGRRFFGDYCSWNRIPEYRDFLFGSPAAGVAAALMGSGSARLFHEHVLVKEPGTSIATPWHQDQPYYCVDGAMTCSLWLALDPVPRETTVEFVAGSHAWGKFFAPERFNKTPLYDGAAFEPLPDIDANRDAYRIAGWALEPGDAVAFSFRTVHGAPANRSADLRRRAFSSRWVGDDATFAVRPGMTSPPFDGVMLQHGDPMDAPEFPLIWPKAS
jgi:ectoine hydroxylase-related dioxygenase (phytanoyl-CoA dioxygenase family)